MEHLGVCICICQQQRTDLQPFQKRPCDSELANGERPHASAGGGGGEERPDFQAAAAPAASPAARLAASPAASPAASSAHPALDLYRS